MLSDTLYIDSAYLYNSFVELSFFTQFRKMRLWNNRLLYVCCEKHLFVVVRWQKLTQRHAKILESNSLFIGGLKINRIEFVCWHSFWIFCLYTQFILNYAYCQINVHKLNHFWKHKMTTKSENVVDDWECIDDSEVSCSIQMAIFAFFLLN